MNKIKPTAMFTPFGGRVEIRMFGKQTGNWSISEIKTREDVWKDAESLNKLWQAAIDASTSKILAPSATQFNAKITNLKHLTNLGNRMTPKLFYRGDNADGVELGKKESYFCATADCAVVVLQDPQSGHTVVAHAGRDSLLDREFILTGNASRAHMSVIEAMTTRFKHLNIPYIRAFICGATGAHLHPLNDVQYREYNRALLHYLMEFYPGVVSITGDDIRLSITTLIEEQLIAYGIKPANIGTDCCDTRTDTDEDGQPLWWSHQRWVHSGTGKRGPDGRNGVLVTRRW